MLHVGKIVKKYCLRMSLWYLIIIRDAHVIQGI